MKRPKIVNASLLTLLSLVMAGSLLGCQSKPSTVSSDSASASVAVSDTASASASVSESASPSPSVDQTPTVTVSEDPTIVWGTEDPDLTQFFTLKVGDSAKTVTSDMLSGSVNTAIEGTYPVTLTTALNGTALTATAQVQVISKVVIDTPYSENPVSMAPISVRASTAIKWLAALPSTSMTGRSPSSPAGSAARSALKRTRLIRLP
ncbi:MAG: hypothetical protein LKM30_07700 [Bacilli bacterium]|nr:hypothetical protein [Bacilli bacterium]